MGVVPNESGADGRAMHGLYPSVVEWTSPDPNRERELSVTSSTVSRALWFLAWAANEALPHTSSAGRPTSSHASAWSRVSGLTGGGSADVLTVGGRIHQVVDRARIGDLDLQHPPIAIRDPG